MDDLSKLLSDFVSNELVKDNVEIYNEFSVQFELAIFFRSQLNNYKVQLERNVAYFGLKKDDFLKKEMDIVVFSPNKKEKHCVELKFPTNGQVPEQIFSACKDVKFLEQLVQRGNFNNSYFMFFTNNHLFYEEQDRQPSESNSIYDIFRTKRIISGEIRKPTGNQNKFIEIDGEYEIKWQGQNDGLKYFIIEVSKGK
ncbi:MAG: hypothetical protein ACP5G8_04755 [Athalassotoga sp.]